MNINKVAKINNILIAYFLSKTMILNQYKKYGGIKMNTLNQKKAELELLEKERELIKNTGYVGVPVALEAVRVEKKYLALKKEITLLENNGVELQLSNGVFKDHLLNVTCYDNEGIYIEVTNQNNNDCVISLNKESSAKLVDFLNKNILKND